LSKAPGFLFAPACEEKQTGVRVLKKREIEFEAFYLSISQEYILCILLLIKWKHLNPSILFDDAFFMFFCI